MEEAGTITSSRKTKFMLGGVLLLLILCGIAVVSLGATVFINDDSTSTNQIRPPNIIFMISDGFSPVSETFARTMSPENVLLALDSMLIGTSRTYSSNSLITDSAAGATAYACGIKTYNGAIAVDDYGKAQATAMEAAKALKYRTGIVTTSRITHATPASFSSHTSHRDFEEDIADQQARNQSVDILFGGGLQKYTERWDGVNLMDFMQTQRNYQTLTTFTEFTKPLKMPVIGLFANQHMDYEIDRLQQNPKTQPSLSEMASKALELLTNADEPFFLLIEGARIDMAGHNHDAYGHYLEIVEYQETVKLVKDWVDNNPNTYVVSVADHATGGITIGLALANGTYQEPYMWYPDNIRGQTASTEVMSNIINANGLDTLNATVLQYSGLQLSDDQYSFIMAQYAQNPDKKTIAHSIGTVLSARGLIGWTTPGHTGVDVNLYAYGKRPQEFGGVMNNIDIGNSLWKELGFVDQMTQITNNLAYLTFPDVPPPDKKSSSHSTTYHGHD